MSGGRQAPRAHHFPASRVQMLYGQCRNARAMKENISAGHVSARDYRRDEDTMMPMKKRSASFTFRLFTQSRAIYL